MNFRKSLYLFMMILMGVCPVRSSFGYQGRLSPADFNRMYHLAHNGQLTTLRDAVNRGLNIDSLSANGDTGLCIAVKRKDYVAYNTFRMSGANPKHPCVYKMLDEYKAFLNDKKLAVIMQANDKNSVYYQGTERVWWPWILGGLVIGGGAYALSSGGGGSKGEGVVDTDSTVRPAEEIKGLSPLVTNYIKDVNNASVDNNQDRTITNDKILGDLQKVQFLPDILSNADYLQTYARVHNGGKYVNYADMYLNDATLGVAVYDNGSSMYNAGSLIIESQNGTIGISASNSAYAENKDTGLISMVFKGYSDGTAVAGMYGDTSANIVNNGLINGTISYGVEPSKETTSEETDEETDEAEEETEEAVSSNAGTILGMTLFDLYTGSNESSKTVSAVNNGTIQLKAGYNGATDAAVSLVGMGSYIDSQFLDGWRNPLNAEKMVLSNTGDISLSYQGKYVISKDNAEKVLKYGKGGLIGMRGDANTTVNNSGKISIDLTSAQMKDEADVAAGMLSVHGADIINNTTGRIVIKNGAEGDDDEMAGGITYGMLAAPGEGAQTEIYKWKEPNVINRGQVDIFASNSYALASFAGGNIVNYGTINLGIENGNSYYTNNAGIYAAGAEDSNSVTLDNEGVINVNSKNSVAMSNAFTGSVDMINRGTIYVSNKATDSVVFGGNYSRAYNYGLIDYRAGNSTDLDVMSALNGEEFETKSVVEVAGRSSTDKDTFINYGDIWVGSSYDFSTIGDEYHGTYATSAVSVNKQGGAENLGTIKLNKFAEDIYSFNFGMLLDKDTTSEAYINNKGTIGVYANGSVGMSNDSEKGAVATNYNTILVSGENSVGMQVGGKGAYVFNGRYESYDNALIDVTGKNSSAMFIKEGIVYNYGTIRLDGDNTVAYVLDGEDATFYDKGVVYHNTDYDTTRYLLINGASQVFDLNEDIVNYTYGKANVVQSGGTLVLSSASKVNVMGEKGHLFVVEGEGSTASVMGEVNIGNSLYEGVGTTDDEKLADKNQFLEKNGTVYGITVKDKGSVSVLGSSTVLTVADENAVGVYSEGSKVDISGSAILNVNKGIGVDAYLFKGKEASEVTNNTKITVKGGVGLRGTGLVSDDIMTTITNGENGIIDVWGVEDGDNYVIGKGVEVLDGAKFVGAEGGSMKVYGNTSAGGDISKYNYGIYAVSSNASVEYSGVINGFLGSGSIGIYANDDAKVSITGNGIINALDYGLYAGGIYNSQGQIVGFGSIFNEGSVTQNTIGIYNANNGYVENSGAVYSNTYGMVVNGGEAKNLNQGKVSSNNVGVHVISGKYVNSGTISGNTTSVIVDGGTFSNASGGKIEKNIGAIKINGGSMLNDGSIVSSSGYAVSITDGSFTNKTDGKMEVSNTSAVELYGGKAYNYGTVTINYTKGDEEEEEDALARAKASYSFADNKDTTGVATVVNAGTMEYKALSSASLSSVSGGYSLTSAIDSVLSDDIGEESGVVKLINTGLVDYGDLSVDFGQGGENENIYVVDNNGTYKANSLSGVVVAGKDITLDSFEDTYVNKDAFVGEDNGLSVASQSYLFDAHLVENDDANKDVVLERKAFDTLIENEELARFFEVNYGLKHNGAVYNVLKEAENKSVFDESLSVESGQRFYANLPRENMDVLRNINASQKKRIFEDGINGVAVGANYYRLGKDGNKGLSEYSDDIYSAYVSLGTKLNSQVSIGGVLSASYVDSKYDDVASERENKVIMAFLPILYQKGQFSALTQPSVGFGFGNYKRHAFSGDYEADTFDMYYGIYNQVEYDIDMKVAELVLDAEFNVQGMSMDKAKEKGGYNLLAQDVLSMETGVGVKLRKLIEFNKKRSLMLALGTKYYHEFLNPYKNLKIDTLGSSVHYGLDGYDEKKNRLKTTAEAVYKDGDFALSAEIVHNLEKKESVEGGVGLRYSF